MFMFSAKLGSNPALSTVEHKKNETHLKYGNRLAYGSQKANTETGVPRLAGIWGFLQTQKLEVCNNNFHHCKISLKISLQWIQRIEPMDFLLASRERRKARHSPKSRTSAPNFPTSRSDTLAADFISMRAVAIPGRSTIRSISASSFVLN